MGTAHTVSMLLLQGDVSSPDHSQWLVIFVGVIALCSLVQLLALVVAGVLALKAWNGISGEIQVLKGKALPLVDSVKTLVADASPKVKTITENTAEVSQFVRSKLAEYEGTIDEANQTIKDVNAKTRAQVAQVDGMVSSALKATSDLATTIHHGIKTPVVEVAGVVNGLKAALDVLVGRTRGTPTKAPGSAAWRASEQASTGYAAGGYPTGSSAASGPVRVVPSQPVVSSHPSSNVAPSPAAEAVVDRLRGEKVKTIY